MCHSYKNSTGFKFPKVRQKGSGSDVCWMAGTQAKPVPSLTNAKKELHLEWWLLMHVSLLLLQKEKTYHIPNITSCHQQHEWSIIQTSQKILITIAVMMSCTSFLIQIDQEWILVWLQCIYIDYHGFIKLWHWDRSSDVRWRLVCPHWWAAPAPSTFAGKVVDRSQLHFAPPQNR